MIARDGVATGVSPNSWRPGVVQFALPLSRVRGNGGDMPWTRREGCRRRRNDPGSAN